MKQILYILLSLLLIGGEATGQQPIHKISYICQTKIIQGNGQDGLNTLYFNNSSSIYIHNQYPVQDKSEWINEFTLHMVKGDPEGFPVHINLANNIMTYKSMYHAAKKPFIFQEEIPKINWVIQKDTKLISKFHCNKATADFAGREYEVWFTKEIPIPLGPYKLGGLPGLILEAESKDKIVSYVFHSYESNIQADASILDQPTFGIQITWSDFKNFVINKLIQTEALSTSEARVTNDDPSPDWDIEKNRYTIISEYKRSRAK